MILDWPDFLAPREVAFLRDVFERAPGADGRASAGAGLQEVKSNREVDPGAEADAVRDLVVEACNRAPMLNYALLPKTVTRPLLSVYEPGMAYGTHTDSAVGTHEGALYRTDLSCTVFLDPPESYQGGELCIDTEYGDRRFKLPPGGAVFYPTLFLHRVAPVTAGRRRACVFWMESLVRDPARRAILFDLAQLGVWVAEREPIDSHARQKLVQVRENLYRMWIEP